MEVKVRPYFKNNKLWHVDMQFVHPHTAEKVRKRIVAPASLTREGAEAWGRELAMQEYLQLCKGPKIDAAQEEEETPKKKAAREFPTLAEFWSTFEARYVSTLRRNTQVNFADAWRVHVKPALGEIRIDKIDRAALHNLLEISRAKGLAIATQQKVIERARRALSWAYEIGIIPTPPPRIRMGRAPKTRKAVYTRSELEKLIVVGRNQVERALLLLLVDAGLRIGECAALRWTDIDLEAGTMTIQRTIVLGHVQECPKGEVGTLPLTPRLAQALRVLIQEGQEPWVLPRQRDDGQVTYWTGNALSKLVHRLQRWAGLDDHGPHRIRHSVLTLLAEGGASPYALQAFARHSLMATTMTYYVHLDKLRKAREAVDMLAGTAPPPTLAPVVPMRPTTPGRGNRLALAGK